MPECRPGCIYGCGVAAMGHQVNCEGSGLGGVV